MSGSPANPGTCIFCPSVGIDDTLGVDEADAIAEDNNEATGGDLGGEEIPSFLFSSVAKFSIRPKSKVDLAVEAWYNGSPPNVNVSLSPPRLAG